jgi:hypothetical protein
MYQTIPITLIIVSSLLSAKSKTSTADVKSSIERVLGAQLEAWNKHDLDGFMRGYWHSPALTFFAGAQAVRGWNQARALPEALSEGRPTDGKTRVPKGRYRTTLTRLSLGSRRVAPYDARWQITAWPVHAYPPQISWQLENHPRPHLERRLSRQHTGVSALGERIQDSVCHNRCALQS